MKFPNKCCRCGFCCLHEQCPISIELHGKKDICPVLSFNGETAVCGLAMIVPIGDGCCIKARAYKDNIEYDFASLPSIMKIGVAQDLKKSKGII